MLLRITVPSSWSLRWAVLCVASTTLTLTAGSIDWQDAARRIRRLPPSEFREVPQAIITELTQRGCTIPQTYADDKLQNLIKGSFAERGTQDWAALCSRQGASSILIFWEAGSPCPAEILPHEDIHWLQDTGNGAGFSRLISTVRRQYIDAHHRVPNASPPPVIDHDGIDEAFIEKGSSVRYCHNGEWLELTGSD